MAHFGTTASTTPCRIIRTLVPTDPLGFVHGATIVASECTDFAARHPSCLPSESLFSHTDSFLCLETEFATWQPALCATCTDFFTHSQWRMHENCLVTQCLFLTLWHPQYFVGHLVFGASCTLSWVLGKYNCEHFVPRLSYSATITFFPTPWAARCAPGVSRYVLYYTVSSEMNTLRPPTKNPAFWIFDY